MKILLVAAMPTESSDITSHLGMTAKGKLADFYPYYSAIRNGKEIFLLQTFVGSIHAPTGRLGAS